ncbi:MAG: protein translocase SEC61 complex subunit gamma [Candidatus Altiarchaeota archaeon]|nr:protein translocase SEC61 complex subunit gamma [Candidatus Altiarchaeota archaeon]
MFENYKRVIRTARRPTGEEFKRSAWLVGLGMLLIGFMGLIINLVFQAVGI